VTNPGVTAADVVAARQALVGVATLTPLHASNALSEQLNAPVFLKCENLQRTGSFKIRGAYVRISRLSARERARGVVAASAGNHAQGVALAAQMLGADSTVFMPVGAPLPKIAATTGYGAKVHLVGANLAETLVVAIEHAKSTGAVFIHPFEHRDIIAGQGTVGLEILEQCPDVATIVVPTGGGGLVSGIAIAVKEARPAIRVVAVQAEGAAAMPGSLAAGMPMALGAVATMADGIAVSAPGPMTFSFVRDLVDEVTTVSEEALSRALLFCLERTKMLVEPAGAAGVAAVLEGLVGAEPGAPVVIVLSGGNVDPLLLMHVVQHGMAAAGRYLRLRLRVPDRPGSLAALLAQLATLGVNVLDVEHSRTGTDLRIGEVEIAVSLETRGPRDRDEVLDQLRATGHTVILS
jgi:threonine dehydratase